MGLSASAIDRRADNHANSTRAASRRKPLMMIIWAAVVSAVIGAFIVAGAVVLNYKPVQQHVEFEITAPNK